VDKNPNNSVRYPKRNRYLNKSYQDIEHSDGILKKKPKFEDFALQQTVDNLSTKLESLKVSEIQSHTKERDVIIA
jgi:hypothetical protein